MKKIKVYIGRCGAIPHLYRADSYYGGVLHGDLFKSKKDARKCYEEVWEAELSLIKKMSPTKTGKQQELSTLTSEV